METSEVLADCFRRNVDGVRAVAGGLDAAALAYRPDAEANSIAWLVWHATRVHDDHVSEIAGADQAWLTDGWVEHFALPFEPRDTGYGHTAADVAAVRPDSPDLLLAYHDAVAERTFRYLGTAGAAELDRIIDRSWDPPVSVGVRLVSVANDETQHIGQAAYVRGLCERLRAGA